MFALGVSPVSSRNLGIVRVRVQFQSGETWTHDQRVTGMYAGKHVIAPADLPYGIEFPEDMTYVRVTSPPGRLGRRPRARR